MSGMWGWLSELVTPVTNLIDELHTSDEERLKIRQAMMQIQAGLTARVLDYETRLAESRAKVITAEAQGASWLQRTWRPITMLTFLALVVFDSFGWLEYRLAEQAWTLLQIGLGGYVVGRSAEKIIPSITSSITRRG